jgi:hypothetical protein
VTWIAEEAIVVVSADGTRTPGRIAIGPPEDSGDGYFQCPVAVEGIIPDTPYQRAIRGDSPLQALVLAAQFVDTMVGMIKEKGGRVVDSTDVEVVLGDASAPKEQPR